MGQGRLEPGHGEARKVWESKQGGRDAVAFSAGRAPESQGARPKATSSAWSQSHAHVFMESVGLPEGVQKLGQHGESQTLFLPSGSGIWVGPELRPAGQ